MIPLSVPNLCGNEWKYIKDCLDTNWVSSVGSYVTLFEEKVAAFCGVKKAVATSNGTSALQISLLLAGVKRNDLVILPNITFVAPANVIKYVGADPILIDIDPNTWQIDLNLLEAFLLNHTTVENKQRVHSTSKRRVAAILPVHVLGNMCDMTQLMRLAKQFDLPVVEDSTEALGSYYNGKHAGGFGLFGCLSFNGNKIITTGGGGMILTNDDQLAKKAKHLTTQAKASADEYYHDEVGYNFRLVNVLAAMGVAQLEQLPDFLQRKKEIADKYNNLFKEIPGTKPQQITTGVEPNNWLYTVSLPNQSTVRKHMAANEIEARPFWVPMNQLPAFANDIYFQERDYSKQVYNTCLSLPCSSGLTDLEQETVISFVKEVYSTIQQAVPTKQNL